MAVVDGYAGDFLKRIFQGKAQASRRDGFDFDEIDGVGELEDGAFGARGCDGEGSELVRGGGRILFLSEQNYGGENLIDDDEMGKDNRDTE